METIEFNEVIKQNIEVVGGLIGVATFEKNGLMDKSRALVDGGTTIKQNEAMLLFETLTHKCFVDIYICHAYRKPVRASLMVSSETVQITARVSYINGSIGNAEFYYSKLENGNWGIYVKNLQAGVVSISCVPVSGIKPLMNLSTLPDDAKLFTEG